MDLKQAIDEFILYIPIEKNYSIHTIRSYEYDLNQFLSFLRDHDCSTKLTDVTTTQVRRFIQHQLKNQLQKPRSVNRKISCLKSFANYSLREKYITHNFMNSIEERISDISNRTCNFK